MKNKAMNALIDMGVPANIKGFKYIVEAMCLYSEEDIWKLSKATFLYEKIAEKNNDKVSTVERAIRHAFSIALTKGNINVVEKYLTFQNTTNANLLAVFYIRLSQEEKKYEY